MVSSIQAPDDRVANSVLPLLRVERTGPTTSRVIGVASTGFLVTDGRGLGITAGHVAKDLVSAKGENDYPAVVFQQPGNVSGKIVPIAAFDWHPVEDVALFRLAVADDYESPYSIAGDSPPAPLEYMLWGYPDDIHYDQIAEGSGLTVDLVFSSGHVRRQFSYELPLDRVPGRRFYELSSPAGSCCSGAPVTTRTPAGIFRAVGIYVGERRNDTNTFAVGYATRSEVIVAQWPQLGTAGVEGLAELCIPGTWANQMAPRWHEAVTN